MRPPSGPTSRSLLTLFVLASALACAAPAPVTPPGGSARVGGAPASETAGAREPALPIDPATLTGKLDNGLTYYIRAHKKPEQRAALRLIVNAGSVLEEDGQRGLAHFVEHMAFNGTSRFKKQEIVSYLEKAGVKFGQHTNAFTSFDETAYLLEVPTDDAKVLETAFVILQQFAAEVTFDPQEVDKERGVVIEEWRLGRGAMMRVLDQQLPVIFQGSRYADRLPIGQVAVLQKASAADLKRFYRDFYRPGLMAVAAVGDFSSDAVLALIRKHLGGLKDPPNPKPRPVFPVPEHKETLAAIATDKELPQASVAVLYKLPHRPTRSRSDYRRMVVERLYHHMLNARLQELARGAEPPFFFGASATQPFVRATDVFMQIAVVKQDGIDRGLAALLREVERVDRHGFTEGEIERAKIDAARGMQSAVKEKDKIEAGALADEMMRHFLVDELMPGIEAEKALTDELLPGVTLEELNRVARGLISDRNRVLMLSAPASAKVPASEKLLALFTEAVEEKLAPYDDKVRKGPLATVTAPPGQVVAERSVPTLGLTEWLLQNGIRVILKPTDFKNDQILFEAWSPGGHSLVDTAEFPSADNADHLVDAGGVGEFGPFELQKALAGKIVGVSPFINELEEGFSGSAAPADLQTAFELLFLAVTAPRTDPNAFAAWREQEREGINNRTLDPGTVFSDEFNTLINRNHPRRRPPSLAALDKVALDRALAIYKQRFKDFSDATFVFVGNFTLEGIKPLLLKYLGALPGKAVRLPAKPAAGGKLPWKARETWTDVGVNLLGGANRFEVRRGVEPKSMVHLAFSGNETWSRERELATDALAEALEIRLREVVREDLSGSYGVSVWGGIARRPRERFRFDISFGCDPANVEKLVKAVRDEIAKVKTSGFSEDVLTKVKNAQLRQHEVNLKNNGFWLQQLGTAYRFDRDPAEITQYPELVRSLSSDSLREMAGRLLNDKRNVLGVLKPEK